MALNTTVGTVASNSYASLQEANDYHASRLHNEQWTAADDADKETALLWATRMLDNRVRFIGQRYGLYHEQALQWPRNSAYDSNGDYIENNVIPKQVKDAQAELAWLLLQSDRTSPSTGASTSALESVKVGPISLKYNPTSDRIDVIPPSVVALLQGLGTAHESGGPRSIRLSRV